MLKYYESTQGKTEVLHETKRIKKSNLFSWEMKRNLKVWLAWLGVVAGLMILTVSLYPVFVDYIEELMTIPGFAQFAENFGFSTSDLASYISAQTQKSWAFFGTMFVVILGIQVVTREYRDGSAEFLYSLPVKRGKVLLNKFLALVLYTILFDLGVSVLTLGTSLIVGGLNAINYLNYVFMTLNLIGVHLLFGLIGFACGAMFKKKASIVLGLIILILMYTFFIIAQIAPDLKFFENFTIFTLFSTNILVNAFNGYNILVLSIWSGVAVVLFLLSLIKFKRNDLI